MAAKPAAKKVLLVSDVVVDRAMQMRAGGTSEDHVNDIALAIKKKAEIPPIEVYDVADHGMVLVSGFHRLAAHQKLNRKEVLAIVHKGTWEEARIAAAAANKDHLGLKRNQADKRRAVWELLKTLADINDRWSINKMAEHVNVSEETVSAIRKEWVAKLEAQNGGQPLPEAKVVGKDGIARKDKAGKAASKPAEEAPDGTSIDSKDWRQMPLKEFLEADEETWAAIDKSEITAAGELHDHLKASGRMGLTKDQAQKCLDQLANLKGTPLPKVEKKPSNEAFSFKQLEEPYGKLVRLIDEVPKHYPNERASPEYQGVMNLMDELDKAIKAWAKKIKAAK